MRALHADAAAAAAAARGRAGGARRGQAAACAAAAATAGGGGRGDADVAERVRSLSRLGSTVGMTERKNKSRTICSFGHGFLTI